jgi:hypothetical protein
MTFTCEAAMLRKMLAKLTRSTRKSAEDRRAMVEAWSLIMGRDSAELWLEALSSRDASRLSNA